MGVTVRTSNNPNFANWLLGAFQVMSYGLNAEQSVLGHWLE